MYKIIFILLLLGNCVAYSQNTINCNTWATNPCGSPLNCNLATVKLFPLSPILSTEPVEYVVPIREEELCTLNEKILGSLGDVIIANVCVNVEPNPFSRFCYQPTTESYANLFVYYNGNRFLESVSPYFGKYTGSLHIDGIDNSHSTVAIDVWPSYVNIRYGVNPLVNLNLGSDLFYAVQGIGLAILKGGFWSYELAGIGVSQYLAQSYIDVEHSELMFGTSDNDVALNKNCNTPINEQVIGTLLYLIEKDSVFGIGREKLHRILRIAVYDLDFNKTQMQSPTQFATSFFKTCTQIKSLHPTLLSGHDLCKIRTVISNYFTPNCDQPTLDVVVDYYIADDVSDIGIQPNPSNASEWESPAIVNRNAPDGLFTNQSAKADTENTLYVEIKNAGCDSLVDARLEIYYALSQTGLTWDDAWDNNIITVGNTDIQAGAKIADIFLPSIPAEGIRVPVTWTPPNIDALNIPSTKINLLSRILSATDVIAETEVKDIRANVRKNNNIAWKVLQLEK